MRTLRDTAEYCKLKLIRLLTKLYYEITYLPIFKHNANKLHRYIAIVPTFWVYVYSVSKVCGKIFGNYGILEI